MLKKRNKETIINSFQISKSGFSLIELMVVITIIGILVMLGSGKFMDRTKEATRAKHLSNAKTLEDSMDRFYLEYDRFPRLSEEAYTKAEVEAYSKRIFDITGEEVELNPDGNYYDIDYVALKDYVKIPDDRDMPNYILQNPVGKVYFMEDTNKEAINRADFNVNNPANQIKNRIDIKTFKSEEEKIVLSINEVKKIKLLVEPSNAHTDVLVWKSSNEDIAIVNSKGDITGLTKGKLRIIITNKTNEMSSSIDVYVMPLDKEEVENIDNLIQQGYIPVANSLDLASIASSGVRVFGKDTKWEKNYFSGLSSKYIQVDDIDLSDIPNFVPIGLVDKKGFVNNYDNPFKGTYNGGAFTISNLKINSSYESVGLFGYINNATVTNVGLINADVKGMANVGGLVGNASGSTVSSSYSSGQVKATGNDVGGLIGQTYSTNILNSYSSANVYGGASGQEAGGLIGWARVSSVIRNSYATGNVTGRANLGGLIGGNSTTPSENTIQNSFYSGSVVRNDSKAGIRVSKEKMKETATFIKWPKDIWNIQEGQYPKLQWEK